MGSIFFSVLFRASHMILMLSHSVYSISFLVQSWVEYKHNTRVICRAYCMSWSWASVNKCSIRVASLGHPISVWVTDVGCNIILLSHIIFTIATLMQDFFVSFYSFNLDIYSLWKKNWGLTLPQMRLNFTVVNFMNVSIDNRPPLAPPLPTPTIQVIQNIIENPFPFCTGA